MRYEDICTRNLAYVSETYLAAAKYRLDMVARQSVLYLEIAIFGSSDGDQPWAYARYRWGVMAKTQ